jgi:hypothetical protein
MLNLLCSYLFVLGKSIKILINYFIGPILALWLSYSLYQQIKTQPNFLLSLQNIFTNLNGIKGVYFFAVLVLGFFNWAIEAKKWQLLVQKIQPISFGRSLQAILSGITLSLNTPNRIGEYGGRVMYINAGNRFKAAAVTVVGSMAQLLVTLVFGSLALVYFLQQLGAQQSFIGVSYFWLKVFAIISGVVTLVFALFYFKISLLVQIANKLPFLQKWQGYFVVIEGFNANFLLRLLVWSALRYTIFVLQYILLLKVSNVAVGLVPVCFVVSLLFWVLAVVPSIAIAELGIRGKFAVALLQMYSTNVVGILSTVLGIWLVNLFIPAILGSVFIVGRKIFKEVK